MGRLKTFKNDTIARSYFRDNGAIIHQTRKSNYSCSCGSSDIIYVGKDVDNNIVGEAWICNKCGI